MSQTQTEWTPANDTVDTTPREKSASMTLLWLIAMLAVAAAGYAWYKNQNARQVLVSDTPAISVPMANEAAITTSQPATETRRADARRQVASVETRSRAPRPLADNPTPKYPAAALRSGIGGTVMVRAHVDASGAPSEVEIVKRSGDRDLDRAALTAVRQWRFEPALRNGKAVSSTVQVPVDFKPI